MTRTIDAKSNRRLPAKLASGLAISALLGLFVAGAFAATASAAEYRGGYHGGYYAPGYSGCCWNGGYYAAPPVVYGSPYYGAPYYAPPPVVYGPGIGIALPGVNINIP